MADDARGATPAEPAGAAPGPSGVLDPHLALQVMAGTDALVRRNLQVNSAVVYLAWGIAWVVGYVGMALAYRPGAVPRAWAFWLLIGVLTAAMAVTFAEAGRASRGVRGRTSAVGRLWGLAWFASFTGAFALLGAVVHRFHPALSAQVLLWALLPVVVVGIVYASSGAMAADPVMALLGVWLCLVGGATAFAPLPHAYLVVAALGGGGMLVAALVSRRLHGRAGRRVH